MSQNAWSLAFYACGHQTPVRGGDRHLDHDCPSCDTASGIDYYAPCQTCGHSREWHVFGPRCRKTSACECTAFKA
jgi:hypothetical protein